ncbi:hypothetical protein BDK51DRAFT_39187 [Blyttiomyces helicus]|uniref:Uncharacterized protein n=1 Tax=Blyttiomyces helicus TaxID=388810 RepID=A0A4P9WBL2_9FUNG|nr:hypothetical protein BDK51DRAFT_39187 [Blyttiomyces helicus]|eukprot:RKO88995.1 hypothetical protein BDK51DRAFT_39187 [Blyttiomyces helicus]
MSLLGSEMLVSPPCAHGSQFLPAPKAREGQRLGEFEPNGGLGRGAGNENEGTEKTAKSASLVGRWSPDEMNLAPSSPLLATAKRRGWTCYAPRTQAGQALQTGGRRFYNRPREAQLGVRGGGDGGQPGAGKNRLLLSRLAACLDLPEICRACPTQFDIQSSVFPLHRDPPLSGIYEPPSYFQFDWPESYSAPSTPMPPETPGSRRLRIDNRALSRQNAHLPFPITRRVDRSFWVAVEMKMSGPGRKRTGDHNSNISVKSNAIEKRGASTTRPSRNARKKATYPDEETTGTWANFCFTMSCTMRRMSSREGPGEGQGSARAVTRAWVMAPLGPTSGWGRGAEAYSDRQFSMKASIPPSPPSKPFTSTSAEVCLSPQAANATTLAPPDLSEP